MLASTPNQYSRNRLFYKRLVDCLDENYDFYVNPFNEAMIVEELPGQIGRVNSLRSY